MVVTKISQKKIKELIAEEKSANKMYRRYGFKNIAKDELRHSRKLSKLLRKK